MITKKQLQEQIQELQSMLDLYKKIDLKKSLYMFETGQAYSSVYVKKIEQKRNELVEENVQLKHELANFKYSGIKESSPLYISSLKTNKILTP
jgi:hypothetical protein